VGKHCRAGQAADDNTTHAHSMLDIWATNTLSLILTAFPLQQWLHTHASVLCYTHTASLVYICLCEAYKFLVEVNPSAQHIRDTVLLQA